ncbi:MAG: peptide chain release factor 2 [Eubacteriales bacterium]|nr:peptide chain release factor 2 [Eubacteriales bacterium]
MLDLDSKRRELEEAGTEINDLRLALKPEKMAAEAQALEAASYAEDFWQDVDQAQRLQTRLSQLKKNLEKFAQVEAEYEDLLALLDLIQEEDEPSLAGELASKEKAWQHQLQELRLQTYFTDKLDASNALLTLHAGAGGTEACDWVSMLFRMYARWAEHEDLALEVLDSVDGDEAGLKSISFAIRGEFAYGLLKHEMGVHRLVRISPFDSSGRRHTSFASLEVLPELDDTIQVDIKEEDLRIDYYRSSGAGGQHVNKTSSAVRLTHLPTNLVVACQNERSQIQNREMAMRMLKAKLYTLARQQQLAEIDDLKGDQKDIAWGNQIRSYVFCPYTLVKDNRTDLQTPDVEGVMDGELNPFIEAMLAKSAAESRQQEGV